MSSITSNYILAVLQHGNISRAAEILGISQPALSSQIKKIENQVGIIIFDRTVKPIALTEEGKVYVKYLKKQKELEREFTEMLAEFDELKKGSLILGGASFFNVSYFSKAITVFSKNILILILQLLMVTWRKSPKKPLTMNSTCLLHRHGILMTDSLMTGLQVREYFYAFLQNGR